jgi:hypothetical protein
MHIDLATWWWFVLQMAKACLVWSLSPKRSCFCFCLLRMGGGDLLIPRREELTKKHTLFFHPKLAGMNTGGGFLLDGAHMGSTGSSRGTVMQVDREAEAITVRKLSSKQEVRLMNYLDDAFLEVNRGFNKRSVQAITSVGTRRQNNL